jgi:hypothetical protein
MMWDKVVWLLQYVKDYKDVIVVAVSLATASPVLCWSQVEGDDEGGAGRVAQIEAGFRTTVDDATGSLKEQIRALADWSVLETLSADPAAQIRYLRAI